MFWDWVPLISDVLRYISPLVLSVGHLYHIIWNKIGRDKWERTRCCTTSVPSDSTKRIYFYLSRLAKRVTIYRNSFYPPISGQPDSRELCVRLINAVVCQVRGPTFSRGHRIRSVISLGLNNLSREVALIATILKSQDCLHHDVFMSWAILCLIGAMLNCFERKKHKFYCISHHSSTRRYIEISVFKLWCHAR